VWGAAAHDVWIVGGGGHALHTTDDGQSWQDLVPNPNHQFRGVWGSGATDVWFVGVAGSAPSGGLVLHTDDGMSFRRDTLPMGTYYLNAVWGAGGVVFAVGEQAALLAYK